MKKLLAGFLVFWLVACERTPEVVTTPPPGDTTAANDTSTLPRFCGTGRIYAWGDSFIAGAGAPYLERFWFLTQAQLGHKVEALGVGGETSSALKDRMVTDNERLQNPAIIWTGRNNYRATDSVRSDLRDIVRALKQVGGHERFIIIGPVTGNYPDEAKGQTGYDKMMLLDSLLQAEWKEHYISAYKVIMSKTLPSDLAWTERGLIPQRFRNGSDNLHFGLQGNTEISLAVAKKASFCK